MFLLGAIRRLSGAKLPVGCIAISFLHYSKTMRLLTVLFTLITVSSTHENLRYIDDCGSYEPGPGNLNCPNTIHYDPESKWRQNGICGMDGCDSTYIKNAWKGTTADSEFETRMDA